MAVLIRRWKGLHAVETHRCNGDADLPFGTVRVNGIVPEDRIGYVFGCQYKAALRKGRFSRFPWLR